jgi:PKD repeat protein
LCLLLAGCAGTQDRQPASVVAPDHSSAQVAFTTTPEKPVAGVPVTFTPQVAIRAHLDLSSMTWSFGDGATSTEFEPRHPYAAAGTYEARLDVRTSDGRTTSAQRIVAVAAALTTTSTTATKSMTAQPTSSGPVKIAATSLDLGHRLAYEYAGQASAVGWDFGDGATSTEASPVHVFPKPGAYQVKVSLVVGGSIVSGTQLITVDHGLPRFFVNDVGRDGPEPSVGVTSDGCIFFLARWYTMRSCDDGQRFTNTGSLLTSPIDSDPYLHVDTDTDRIFQVNMVDIVCSWIAWSDDGARSWLANPADCGPVPVNDHIKLGTGPWVGTTSALSASPVYPNAVYFCYNKIYTNFHCYTSLDGGATFTVGGMVLGCSGGLHGAITTAPDGTVYVPPRRDVPTVCMSKDNGRTWSQKTMGASEGTPSPRKNSEVATDSASNAYHAWVGKDHGVYFSRSIDSGQSWGSAYRLSPATVTSATFVQMQAGDPGRIAVAYLGSENEAGNPHLAPATAIYHLYVTFSLDALDDQPTFTTVRVSQDPVQVGSICLLSSDCKNGNRNLLDFNDLSLTPDGRVVVAFADGCIASCATSPDPTPASSRSSLGTVAVLREGPSLYAEVGRVAMP